ncbi:hypothetical protein [Gandjariella thermophila]|uniref:ESX-1 secretion-associated protein n=1 Tax=Gandjariella thermophila TaxID=1931992 RepID=A0A4D4JHD7_9PSEU|nr:hypothetical protein [Gandjariella thermophila]GDY33307.1 hypothetical protein GTS_49400 [Gandjariella thermophila]
MGEGAANVSVTTDWLRKRADDCDDCANAIGQQLGPASDACETIRQAAPGWEFVNSLPDMRTRWEELNNLLRERLGDGAKKFRACADQYDHNESAISTLLHAIFG